MRLASSTGMILLGRYALGCLTAMVLAGASSYVAAPAIDAQGGAPRMQADPICAAGCEARKAKILAEATSLRDAGGYYYGTMSNNCPQPWDQPRGAQAACWVSNEDCKKKCAGLWDERYRSCLAACSDALQPCCYAAEVKNQEHALSQCVADCPLVPASAPSTAGRTLVINAAADDALHSVFNQPPPGMTQKEYDDRRRQRVFAAVGDQIEKMSAAYAVVSGGGDRLWIIGPKPDSQQILIDGALARFVRGKGDAPSDLDKQLEKLTKQGLSLEVLNQINGAIALAPGGEFKAGDALFFPPGGKWPAEIAKLYEASSEHSSIRGTINGGGDFI